MYWMPYRLSDFKAINNWFDQKQNENIINIKKMKSFFKNLIFDRTVVKNLKAKHVNKNQLSLYLQEGKISLQEYLQICR